MSKIVQRTLEVFELFAREARPLSLSEAAKLLDIPISSCHDVLQTMERRGFLYQLGPRSGYYPTLRVSRMMNTIAEGDPVVQRAEIALRTLRDELDESVSLARIDGLSATYLLLLEPSHPLRFTVQVGDRVRSLYATATGKAVLATLPPDRRRSVIAGLDLVPYTTHTIASHEQLARDIEQSLSRGWFLNRGESVDGGITLAAGFVWNRSYFVITVAGPMSRIDPRLDGIAARMRECCRELENP